MGNRAIITTKERETYVYLHWNGGRDTVEPLLRYCELQGYRPPSEDCYGFARMCQVMGNFFGGTLSLGVGAYTTDAEMDPGDNGIYVIEGWRIAEHLKCEYGPDWEPVGTREVQPWKEQHEHDFDAMLRELDEAMPERLRLGDFLDSVEVPTSSLVIGDEVWMRKFEDGWKAFPVVGFGLPNSRWEDYGTEEVPYVAMWDHDGDWSWNANNYLFDDTVRIRPRRDAGTKADVPGEPS